MKNPNFLFDCHSFLMSRFNEIINIICFIVVMKLTLAINHTIIKKVMFSKLILKDFE